MKNLLLSVAEYLFADSHMNAYAILDGASVPRLPESLYRHQPQYECLYRGELKPDMQEVAPYLVHLQPDTPFTDWVIDQGWGKHWGIFAISEANLRDLRKHFRMFLVVHDPDGKPLIFRYYDPRVLRLYLPTCNGEELGTVFGPVASYLLEDEDPATALRFRADSGELKSEKLMLKAK